MQFVFESTSGHSLYTAEAMHAVCRLEDRLVRDYQPSLYATPDQVCRQLSLPFYIAVLMGKETCYDITNEDILKFGRLLLECWPSFRDQCTSKSPTQDSGNATDCEKFSAVNNVLCYLVDLGFVSNNSAILGNLTYTSLLLSQYAVSVNDDDVETYFKSFLQKAGASYGPVKLTGFYYNRNVKYNLFNDYFMDDIWLFGLAMGIILAIMFFYLFSLTLMIATLLNVVFSFVTAFCLYHLIFGIDFFPFINVLAGLILIAIGADDVFIFHDTWSQIKTEDSNIPLDVLVAKTFNHAALSIFVTSLTTSAAFFANSVSHITAIKCFGLFAGLAVLANFFFMITWTPALIIMIEKYRKCSLGTAIVFVGSLIIVLPLVITRLLDFLLEGLCSLCTLQRNLSRITDFVFGNVLPKIIQRLWALLLVLFLGVGVGGFVVVFYSPKLKLPHEADMQLFPTSQYMEHWDQELRTHFRYINEADDQDKIYITFFWGVKPDDNGGQFDTRASSTLVQDQTFNISTPAAQKWMREFCLDLIQQPFIDSRYKDRPQVCVLDSEMCPDFARLSNDSQRLVKNETLRFCCELNFTDQRTSSDALEECLPVLSLAQLSLLGTVIFDPHTNKPTAYDLGILTSESFSGSYEKMNEHLNTFQAYLDKKLASAPDGLRNGWWNSWAFQFYDLQDSIAHSTYYSIVLSISVAFVVMLLTSLNVLITIYALFTITLAIAATIACLVFMGWELSIIESVTISLAVGLSIDFTIHYGVAYRLSSEKRSAGRVREAFARVGSAVVMAALTTFLAGTAVMPSHIMAYRQLGIFLMLVMAMSWLFATFFFQSLCHLAGPRGNFCQIPLPCARKKLLNVDTELENHTASSSSLMLRSDSEDSLLVTF